MGLSLERKSAAPPVSSPARQDRCKVGEERKKEVKDKGHERANSSLKAMCCNSDVRGRMTGQNDGRKEEEEKNVGDLKQEKRRVAI